MTRFTTVILALAATPALAAEGKPFFSLANTDFVVTLAFLLFFGVLFYFKVPGLLAGLLDKRAEGIQKELDEARTLREEAQAVLASYERKQREVAEQADAIVAHARDEAAAAAEQAKADIQRSIERRLAAAEDQIASAEASALRQVKDRAVAVAVAAAGEVIAKNMSEGDADALIASSIKTVEAKLH
jgi:F-type H+-transporting ATPase subunit b